MMSGNDERPPERDLGEPAPASLRVSVLTPGFVAASLALLVVGTLWTGRLDRAREPGLIGHHDGGVRALAFSPDGASVASAGTVDGTVALWDLPGKRRWIICDRGELFYNVLFSPDGSTLAAGRQNGATVSFWDVAFGAETVGLPVAARALALSPDGSMLAAGGADGRIGIWDVAQRRLRATLGEPGPGVTTLTFLHDGQSLAVADTNGNISVWDVGETQRKTTFGTHTGAVLRVAFAQDGRLVATTEFGDFPLHLWEMSTGNHIRALRHPGGMAAAVAFSPDGQTLASGGRHGTIILWDANRGTERATLRDRDDLVFALGFSADGSRLASGSNEGRVRLWDLRTMPSRPAAK
jgi:WD40 repeat protein